MSEPIPWRRGIAFGAGAGLTLYACVTILLAFQLRTLSAGTGLTTQTLAFGLLGDFFAAHPGAVDVQPGVRGNDVPPVFYSGLAFAVLCWAGYRTAAGSASRSQPLAGTTVALGYVPVVVATLVAVWRLDPGFVTLDPLRALVVAGVLVPAVYGAVGGGLRWLVATRSQG